MDKRVILRSLSNSTECISGCEANANRIIA